VDVNFSKTSTALAPSSHDTEQEYAILEGLVDQQRQLKSSAPAACGSGRIDERKRGEIPPSGISQLLFKAGMPLQRAGPERRKEAGRVFFPSAGPCDYSPRIQSFAATSSDRTEPVNWKLRTR
jgi:hypothetical protein